VNTNRSTADAFTGAAIGAVAGVVGSFLMVRLQNAIMNATTDGGSTADVPKHREPGNPERKEQADASAKVAEKAVELATGKRLDRQQRKRGGELVHYAFGAGAGAIYGAFYVERQKQEQKLTADEHKKRRINADQAQAQEELTTKAKATAKAVAVGAAYGLAIWVAFDLVILPAARLAPKPQEQAPQRLALGAASHAVYGGTLAFTAKYAMG
jgi:putative membrane protein